MRSPQNGTGVPGALHIFMLIFGLLLGATCADSQGYLCDRSVAATIARSGENRIKINAALGEVLALELPANVEMRGEPALGNAALFDVKVVAKPLRVLVWAKQPANAPGLEPAALVGSRSNLQLFLDSGITLMIELRIAEAKRAVQRVEFRFPERDSEAEYVRERVAEESRRLEEEYRGKQAALEDNLGALARERLATGMLSHAECEDLSERSMHDLVVLRAHQICRIGSDFFVTFSLHNRTREAFAVDTVEVRASASETQVDAVLTFEGVRDLSFDRRVRGVVAWTIDEDGQVPSKWSLLAKERGTRGRTVELEVGF